MSPSLHGGDDGGVCPKDLQVRGMRPKGGCGESLWMESVDKQV
jgi:hypothetical protein